MSRPRHARFGAGIMLALVGTTLLSGACSRSSEPAAPSGAFEAAPAVVAALPPESPPANPLPAPPAARSFADFRPSLHAFRFINQFTGSPLPISLGGLESRLGVPDHYGLCGGMSFAAADFYLANLEPPGVTAPPAKGDDLYSYLVSRQLQSLGDSLELIPKFATWMSLPDVTPGGTRFRTLLSLGSIFSHLEHGQPALLGLVLCSTADKGALWENHQVLAYAAARRDDGTRLLRIYDPNFPMNDGAVLELRPCTVGPLVLGPSLGHPGVLCVPCPGVEVVRRAPGRRDLAVRGFFEIPYAPQVPPARLLEAPGNRR